MKGVPQKYTKEQIDYIYKHYKECMKPEILVEINKIGPVHTKNSLKAFYHSHGLASGIDCRMKSGNISKNKGYRLTKETYDKVKKTMFKPGIKPWNTKKIGDEALMKDKSGAVYIKVKVAEPNVWVLKQRLVWEKYNGPIPDNYIICFLDGNTKNCNIENLAVMSRAESIYVNHYLNHFKSAEEKKIAIDLARIYVKTNDLQK